MEIHKELQSVMVPLCYLAISTKVLREDRETTRLIINVFSLQRGLQDKKKKNKGVKNKRESVTSLTILDSTFRSRDISHLPGKSQSSKSFSYSQCLGPETKHIAQYILKMKNRTSKSRNGLKKDVIKRITSPYYQSTILSDSS